MTRQPRLIGSLLFFITILLFFNLYSARAAAKPSTTPDTRHDELLDIQKFTGDFDAMHKRHIIRALVVYNDLLYFFDNGTPHGASYEALKLFEKFVNKKLRKGTVKIRLVFIPTPRNRIFTDLVSGRGDLAVGNLTITPARRRLVDFSDPFIKNVKEILVTGPKAGKVESLEELAGREIMVRRSSSYYEHLQDFNQKLRRKGKKPIVLKPAPIYLEDDDLLEMVNSGILPWAVVDDHKAGLWAQVYKKLTLHENLVIHEGGEIAWAMRKNCPKLKKLVNQFVKKHRRGTLIGNILFKRYMQNNKWAKNPLNEKERKKFEETVDLFRQYAKQYNFDYLMLMALAYQESQLDQSKRSPAGAIGIMQILKNTAADPKIGIPDIEKIDNNIRAGTKYLRFIYDNYYGRDEKIDKLNKMLFSFASYNAGPRKITKMRKLAARMGLNPNIWFNNVELAVAKKIGRETVQYVSNIYKYYVAYRLVSEQQAKKRVQKSVK
ncbi:MAG: lytic transglycosylase F [Deltaproteobacteria bacterium]|nr:lytic transglycosylase F [Deltaproteobacteria bacterium]